MCNLQLSIFILKILMIHCTKLRVENYPLTSSNLDLMSHNAVSLIHVDH